MFLANSLAVCLRSSLYGAFRRKEKRPFSISNSLQPVSGSTSVSLQTAGCLRLQSIVAVRWMLIKILSGVISVEAIIRKLFFFFVPLFQHSDIIQNLCRPPNWERSRGFYHFVVKSDMKNQQFVIFLRLFRLKYHGFFIPTPP